MPFTDDDLNNFTLCVNLCSRGKISDTMLLGILARLKAAESVIAESFDPTGMVYIGYDSWHEALAKWRKVAGK